MVRKNKPNVGSSSRHYRGAPNDDSDSDNSATSTASTIKNEEVVVVLSDSDNESDNEQNNTRELLEDELQSDEEEEGDALEVVQEEDDDDEEDVEESRTERQRRDDVWYPKSVDEIDEATRIHTDNQLRPEDRVNVNNFTIIQVLGTGAYGKVFLVRKNDGVDGGTLYAMKVLKKCTVISKKKTAEHTKTERQVLEKIRHKPFLAGMHYAFTDDCHLYIVLDYVCGGELFTHLYHREKFSEEELRIYIAELIIALEQLHEIGIIYRDIKLENVLIDRDGHIVLTDFGLSRKLNPYERAHSYCGTMEYMAPEIVKSELYRGHDFSVDWWSVGVLLIELLTGSSPFATTEGAKQEEIANKILKEDPHINNCNPTPPCRDLIRRLLDKNPTTRIGCGKTKSEEIKKHPFFRDIDWKKLTNKEYTPAIRPKIEDELDTQNFSEEFTTLPVQNSPGVIPDHTSYLFRGFSYTGPEFCGQAELVVEDDDEGEEEEEQQPEHSDDENEIDSELEKLIAEIPPVSEKYQIITNTSLNSGSFATCYKAFSFERNENCAAKAMTYTNYQPEEVDCLRKLDHINIVKLYDVVKSSSYIYLVMEFLEGGELYDYVKNSPLERLDEEISKNIIKQVASALEYMHSQNFIHRDIKPENIMFTNDNYDCVKLIDFGFSRYIEDGEPFLSDPRFTLDYAPPEILKSPETNRSLYCKGNDIWSLGTVIYTMLVGHPPFRHKIGENDADTVRKRILVCDYDKNETWSELSTSSRNLILKTFEIDFEKRISASEVLAHEWFEPSVFEDLEEIVDIQDDAESDISAGDLDSIISKSDNEVVPEESGENEDSIEILLDLQDSPASENNVQPTEENNNTKNESKDESELLETLVVTDDLEEDLLGFDSQNLETTEIFESLTKNALIHTAKIKVVKKKIVKEIKKPMARNHSVPIKKRHNYRNSPEEPVPKQVQHQTVQKTISINKILDIEEVELIGFKPSKYIPLIAKDLLVTMTDDIYPKRRGRRVTRLRTMYFKPSQTLEIPKKSVKINQPSKSPAPVRPTKSSKTPDLKTTTKKDAKSVTVTPKRGRPRTAQTKPQVKAEIKTVETTVAPKKGRPHIQMRRTEIDSKPVTFSPRKTRYSTGKRGEKPVVAIAPFYVKRDRKRKTVEETAPIVKKRSKPTIFTGNLKDFHNNSDNFDTTNLPGIRILDKRTF